MQIPTGSLQKNNCCNNIRPPGSADICTRVCTQQPLAGGCRPALPRNFRMLTARSSKIIRESCSLTWGHHRRTTLHIPRSDPSVGCFRCLHCRGGVVGGGGRTAEE